jgi:1-acyl-sn-glycerol-3-phosphate acyltransferase
VKVQEFVGRHDFLKQLVRDSGYRTGEPGSALFPSLKYHSGTFRAVIRAGIRAGRGQLDSEHWVLGSWEAIRAGERAGGRYDISGLQNIAVDDDAVVFVSNHMSSLETLVLGAMIIPFRDASFILKKSLLGYPFLGEILRMGRPIQVGRRNPREDLKTVLEEGRDLLGRGRSVIVFPQATRSRTLDPSKFNTLGVKLARHAGVRIVPLALKTDFLENGRIFKDLGRVRPERTIHFEFGRPLAVEGNGREQHQAVICFIREKLAGWRDEH